MVRALLDGTKTQTRRAVKPYEARNGARSVHADVVIDHDGFAHRACPYGRPGDGLWVRETFFAYGRWETRYSEKLKRDECRFVDMTTECDRAYRYAADGPDVPLAQGRAPLPGWHKRPAIHMPRAASRIGLEIVSVHVERLQDIDRADAVAEGIERIENYLGNGPVYCDYRMSDPRDIAAWFDSPVDSYRTLWEAINGAGSWEVNPRVWVVEFERMRP